MIYVASVMGLIMACEIWCLWRVLDRLLVLTRVEDRLSTLTHTMALLTDTTETCFQAIAGQLEYERPTRAAAPVLRATRQRRAVGAARRGRSVTEIAVAVKVAEVKRCVCILQIDSLEGGRTSWLGVHITIVAAGGPTSSCAAPVWVCVDGTWSARHNASVHREAAVARRAPASSSVPIRAAVGVAASSRGDHVDEAACAQRTALPAGRSAPSCRT